eukprot:15337258-Ditylum_brightwellii.AAC.1
MVTSALYSIAINGVGVGLYCSLRLTLASANLRIIACQRAPLRSYVSFPLLEEEGILEDEKKEEKNQAVQIKVDWRDNKEIDLDIGQGSDILSDNPEVKQKLWRVWEKVHNEMVRLAEF